MVGGNNKKENNKTAKGEGTCAEQYRTGKLALYG